MIVGNHYLDPGSRLSGRYDPPRRCVVLNQFGPVLMASRHPAGTELLEVHWLHDCAPGSAPRNVAIRYLDGGHEAVVPFPRRLRKVPPDA